MTATDALVVTTDLTRGDSGAPALHPDRFALDGLRLGDLAGPRYRGLPEAAPLALLVWEVAD